MAERIPPGVVNYKPYDFAELEQLIYLSRRPGRYHFTEDNVAVRSARSKDELGEHIPEIEIIWDFFRGHQYSPSTRTEDVTQKVTALNQHMLHLRDVSPLYVAMKLRSSNEARAGKLVGFTNTDMGIQPLLKSPLSTNFGLPPIGAIYAEPALIQKIGPVNLYRGRRR